jgi:thiol-disulfide isomerase/thioredoxin
MNIFLLSWFLALSGAAAQWHENLPSALEAAKASGSPILADFQAPWCYSCYYMEEKVLSKEAFAAAAKGLVLLKLDVDQPGGRALKEKYAVNFLPSYLLLDSKGKALGRIMGEQTEGDFLARLAALRAGASDKADQALESMRAAMGAGEYDRALREAAALPEERRKALELRPEWRILGQRAALMAAVKGHRPGGHEPLRRLLELDRSCDLAYDAAYAEDLVETLAPASRQSVLRAEQQVLERLVDEKVLIDGPARCADLRTSIEALADVYAKLDMKDKRLSLIARALAFLEKSAKTGEDRNRDDNYRYFLEQAGDDARLRAFYGELTAAYPADYVYPYRYAKYLAGKKEFEPALAWAEKADRLSYGANRLVVTGVRAKALVALGRTEEAEKLLKRDIRTAARAFSKDVKPLEALLRDLSK